MEYPCCVALHCALCQCPSNEPIKACGQFRLQYTETGSRCTKGRWDIWEGVSSFWIHHRRVKRQHCTRPRILQKARKGKKTLYYIINKTYKFKLFRKKKIIIYLYECRDDFKSPNDQEKWSYYNEWEQRIANNSKHLSVRHLEIKLKTITGYPIQLIKIICYLTRHKI